MRTRETVLAGWMLALATMNAAVLASNSVTGPQQQAPVAAPRFGLSSPKPRTPGSIRLATYNVLNLFDHADDPTLSGEFDDIKSSTPADRCEALAKAIRKVDADVIALQEVESLEALVWFRDTYLRDAGYNHLASRDAGYYRGVECSIMSRLPIMETTVWLGEDLSDLPRSGEGWAPAPPGNLSFQRSPLLVTVEAPGGYRLTIIALHHKAGREFDHAREAEAIRINQIIDELERQDPGRNIVVMGDFNAAPWDKSVRVYLANGLIDAFAHRSTEKSNPESRQFKTHESDRVLDFILLNSAACRELVIGSAFVLGTVTPAEGYDFRTDTPPPGYASDHYPVALELMPGDVK